MSLESAILAAALGLSVYKEDRSPELASAKREQLTLVASAIAVESRKQTIATAVDWAALMLTIADSESGLSLRIHAGVCKPHECDRGKARGPWQTHAYGQAATFWDSLTGVENTALQTKVASSRLQVGYYTCRGAADWLTSTINGFAGQRCSRSWTGLNQRVEKWRRIRVSIQREMVKP